MSSNVHQPWERRSSPTSPPGQQQQQTLPSINSFGGIPSGIPNVNPSTNGHSPPLSNAPPSTDVRDSGNWSMNSARASNISDTSFSMTLPPIDHATARHSPPETQTFPHSHSPVASSFAASQTSLHTGPAHQYGQHGHDSLPSPSPSASRRSSFDSRLGNLQLSSPINGTPAASQVSLSSTLFKERDSLASQIQRERGIHSNSPCPPRMEPNGHDPSNPHGQMSNPFGSANRTSTTTPARTAPPIMGQQRYPYGQGPHPNALTPTKGFPYAFPDPDLATEGGRPSNDGGRVGGGSLAGSAASSTYSMNSGHVPQHPMNIGLNGMPQMGQPAQHHHHNLQQRRSSIGDGSTPYSRTPELRISHKLAERKRRKEMKELFDELRDALPAERGGKSSKWEVLTKAIEHVKDQKTTIDKHSLELERLRMETDQRRNEMDQMRAELQNLRNQMGTYAHGPPHHTNGNQYVTHMNGYRPPTAQSGNDGSYHHNDNSGKMQGLEPC